MAMKCAVHTERDAVAYCRNCGKAMCPDCTRDVRGMIYCEDCLVDRVQSTPAPAGVPYTAAPGSPSPALAFLLGFIPGVGAIYNGQFAKAFLHVVLFGVLVSLVHGQGIPNRFEPLFGMLIAFLVFYMVGDAYWTAKRRQMGMKIDEWSGLLGQNSRMQGAAGALVLIAIGMIFLLDTTGILPLSSILRYWPLILIAAGVLMLLQRMGGGRPASGHDDLSLS